MKIKYERQYKSVASLVRFRKGPRHIELKCLGRILQHLESGKFIAVVNTLGGQVVSGDYLDLPTAITGAHSLA